MPDINLFNTPCESVGHDLMRPECVLSTKAGDIFVSDFRGGVTHINSLGSQTFYGGSCKDLGLLKTNGFALLADGSFLIAHLGDVEGGVFRLTRDNQIRPWLREVEGQALPPTNYVHLDHQGRVWITVSTRINPRAKAYRQDIADGFIVLVDNKGARIVADGLGYTNECWVDPSGSRLYANATFSRQLLCWDIRANNDLTHRRVVTNFGEGTYPDGLTADVGGNFWITSIISNRVIKVAPDGDQQIYLENSDAIHVNNAEAAYASHKMTRHHLEDNPASKLKNISSMAFFGDHLDTLLLGCLLDTKIVQISNSLVNGVAPAHWRF